MIDYKQTLYDLIGKDRLTSDEVRAIDAAIAALGASDQPINIQAAISDLLTIKRLVSPCHGPMLDMIIAETRLPLGAVNMILLHLEMNDYVKNIGNQQYIRCSRR